MSDEPKCEGGRFGSDCHNPATDPHACPFLVEIHDDETTLCNCCIGCMTDCRYDI